MLQTVAQTGVQPGQMGFKNVDVQYYEGGRIERNNKLTLKIGTPCLPCFCGSMVIKRR